MFNIIDMKKWVRGAEFEFFTKDPMFRNTKFCLTVNVDVTSFVERLKDRGLKFYPSFVYIIAKIINRHDEFKMSFDADGNAGYWDKVNVVHPVFDRDTQTITKVCTVWTEDFSDFYGAVLESQKQAKEFDGVNAPDMPPNIFDVSCLPWVHYTGYFIYGAGGGTYLAPYVTWGKYELKEGKLQMPLTMMIDHAAADGFHVSRFFSEVQELVYDAAEHL